MREMVMKEVTVGTSKVKAVWTPEMVDDIKRVSSSFADISDMESKLIREIQMAEKMAKRGRKIDELLS